MMQYGDIPLLHLKGTYRVEVHLQMGMERNSLSCLAEPGNILYVRETWKKAPNGYYYYEDWQKNVIADITKWKPSIHMPKEAARIWLKVTDVKVERLQNITEDGSKAEGAIDNRGFIHFSDDEYDRIHTAREHFMKSGTALSRNPILSATVGIHPRGCGLLNLNGAKSRKECE